MSKGLKMFLGILALILLAGAGVMGFLFFRWNSDKKDAEKANKEYKARMADYPEGEKPDTESISHWEQQVIEDGTEGKTEEATEAATEAATEEPKPAVQLSGNAAAFQDKISDKAINIYSWNTEVGDRLNYFYDKYPELKSKVNFINLGLGGTSDDYKIALQNAIDLGGDSYPSIICLDNDVAHYFLQSDWCMNISDLGITSDMTKNCYSYTLDFATVNGQLKALSWQACPGSFIYRNDIAEQVFGTSDPTAIQSELSNWDSFMNAADKLLAAGYKIVSGPDDIKYAFLDQRTSPWVQDGKLVVDPSVVEYLEISKRLYDGGYTNRTSMWNSDWNANFSSDVFGYFGCTWFVYWCIPQESKFFGNCSICQGPVSYHWGGSYLAVMKDCPNPGLAALVLYTLCCDTETMERLSEETLDFVNNQQAISNLIAAGKGGNEVLAGFNPLTIWDSAAKGLSLKNATEYDSTINGYMDTASMAYNSGELPSVDAAIDSIKTDVSSTYPYIDTE